MNSLINVKFNWPVFGAIAIAIYMLFPEISGYSYFAILVSLHQFTLLFNAIGYVIPVRYLFGSFMCMQMLIGPMLAYNGLDSFQFEQYRMQIPETDYFGYVIPAIIGFILGLHFYAGKLDGELIDELGIEKFVTKYKNLPYFFIVIGFVSSIAAEFFSSDFAFVFYLLAGFKFIGAFMIIMGNKRLKVLPLIIVYGAIIASSLGEGMFHDLLTWMIFLGCVFAAKYKPGLKIKSIVGVLFLLLILTIQQLKGDYREATWKGGEEANLATISKVYNESESKNTFFSTQSLATSNLRFNQGYIITYIMKNIPGRMPYAEGKELMQILEASFLPRFLAPNKLKAGDREFFMKYSGMRIAKGTSMGLSSVGDAYINFGVFGGCIFMFFLGIMYNQVLKGLRRISSFFPVLLLFTPLVFYYPIRPDCELQTILGHLVKSCFLLYVVFSIWKKYFIIYPQTTEKDIYTHPLVSSRL